MKEHTRTDEPVAHQRRALAGHRGLADPVRIRLGTTMLAAKIGLTLLLVTSLFGIGLINVANPDAMESIALDHLEQGLVVAVP